MSMSDPIADMLTRIRNGQGARKASIFCPSSRKRIRVLEVLKKEGYIRGYEEKTSAENGLPVLRVDLKYDQGRPVIQRIDRVSTPGRRVYYKLADLKASRFYNGLGIRVVSTSRGVMSDHEALVSGQGGEVICQVF